MIEYQALLERVGERPIIAAVRTLEDARIAAASKVAACFLLGGTLGELRSSVKLLRGAGKLTLVHLDLVEGLSKDSHAVQILAEQVAPDGILTTKSALISSIQGCGLLAGLRCFILDSQSYRVAAKLTRTAKPDFVELMPGVLPRIITRFCEEVGTPVIAGGLIDNGMDAEQAFAAGALGISTSARGLWAF